jgi:hypothetical protein
MTSSKDQLSADYAEPLLLPGTGVPTEREGILGYCIPELAHDDNIGCDSEC